MQFFKQEHVFKKLKEDAGNLKKTMNYVEEQLNNPCEIFSIEKSWPTEKVLTEDRANLQEVRKEVVEFSKRNQVNRNEMAEFRQNTEVFVNTVDAQIDDMLSQLEKYGMKPMPLEPSNHQQHNAEHLENGLEDASVAQNE